MKRRNAGNSLVPIGIGIVVIMVIILIVSIVIKQRGGSGGLGGGKTLDQLYDKVKVTEATPRKGQVTFESNNLYDELPEIDKYPLAVTGKGSVDIEIFTSGEKAGKDNDSWLIDVANKFNGENHTLSNGMSVSMSVRSVASGTAADYIISGKYVPDLYTPSNTLFGEYAKTNGGSLEIYEKRLVGNTAGILIKKGAYSDFDSVIKAVQDNQINVGYTNPQTSATGLNLLLTLLKDGTENFTKFNANIPYVAYTTQQMRDSASNGSLDGMLTEYQAYINDANLTSMYDFIPFGVRHDNPVYICDKEGKTQDEMDAVKMIVDYCKSPEMQQIATGKGFNANDDYTTDLDFTGAEVTQALVTYKKEKDNGKDIIAVFVADNSGSMDGEPMNELKSSLSNGLSYINDNNYVGLVSYSNNVTIELPIAQLDLNQRSYFQGAIDDMKAQGGTSTYEALVVAAKMVQDAQKDHPDAKCMIILLSDGYANGNYTVSDIENPIKDSGIPIYTISYGSDADKDELQKVSNINEAASINADSDDITYKLKSLFNSQL
ncbi:MAG: VWA domain-containing protein [Eubacterium sp.]|nr:VWA domain-containing protein [Eubacterium sp.]